MVEAESHFHKSQEEFMWETLPFSDLGGWIYEGSIYDEAYYSVPLPRLANIKSLSFLSFVGPDPQTQYFIGYNQDRFDHSLVVGMVSQEILARNGYPREVIEAGGLIGLIHDIATPAHGDPVMAIDPKNLNEEEHWQEVVGEKGEKLIEKYRMTVESTATAIKNQGFLGQVLDVADRITYVMKDLHEMITYGMSPDDDPYLSELIRLANREGRIGNIYKDVKIDPTTHEIYFSDKERLKTFLELRAFLHQRLYLHPISQGRDLFIMNLVRPFYAPDGSLPLSPQLLRKMTDTNLMEFLASRYHPDLPAYHTLWDTLVNWYPEYTKVDSEKEAEEVKKGILESSDTVFIGIRKIRGVNGGDSYQVATKDGALPLSKVYPEGVQEIREITNSIPGTYVYSKKISDGNSPIEKLLGRFAAANGQRAFR